MAIDLNKVKPVKAKDDSKEEFNIMNFLNKDIKLFEAGISDKVKASFYQELEILLSSGIDINTALTLIINEIKNKKEKEVFEQIRTTVIEEGKELSEALMKSGKFNTYEYYNIQIGQETGRIAAVLKELSIYYQNRIKQKRQLVSALIYPAFMMIVCSGVLIFMLTFVVPMISKMFKSAGASLPWISQVVINASDWMIRYFWVGLLFFIVSGTFLYLNKKQEWYRKFFSALVLRIPVLNDFIRKVYLARFCNSMALLISSKVPLIKALSMVELMIEFYPLQKAIREVQAAILAKGGSLNETMAMHDVFFPRLISLIKVGEEVNQLDYFFSTLSKQYTEEVDHQTGVISKLIDPIMLLFIAFVVGTIVIAMYLPLVNLGSTIH
jgi:type IV pilus assembly protein PilC